MKILQYIVRTTINTVIGLLCLFVVYKVNVWLGNPRWFIWVVMSVMIVDFALIFTGIYEEGLVDVYHKVVRR